MTKQILSALKVVVLALALSFGLSYALAAWTPPAAQPPNANVAAPINVGSTTQTKTGGDVCTTVSGVTKCLQTVGGASLPAGTSGQTLRSDGTNWLANSNIFNNGTNVGIGTTVPNAKLDLGTGYGANGEKFLIYNDNTSSSLAGTKVGFYMDRFGSNNINLVFPTAAAAPGSYMVASKDTSGTTLVPRLTVLGETGNVGIGTTAPVYKLDVNGSVNAVAGINTRGGSTSYYGIGEIPMNATSANDLDSTRPNRVGSPILRINDHTGVSISAHSVYGGIRFYNQGYSGSNPNPYDSTIGGQMVMAITDGRIYTPSYVEANNYYIGALGAWASQTASVGVGQTWQTVTGSRALNTTYTNNTGRPIFVSISMGVGGNSGGIIYVDGAERGRFYASAANAQGQLTAIVPAGSTYYATPSAAGGALIQWSELR